MANRDELLLNINQALGAHGAWKLKLKTAVATKAHGLNHQEAGCDRCCKFGAWLHGPGIDSETRTGVPYRTIKRLHSEFHESAGRVARLAREGDSDQANAILNDEFAHRSDKLNRALMLWKRQLT